MHYHKDLTFEQIAEYLHMKRGAVYTAKFRALDQLRELVQKRLERREKKRSP